MRVGIFVLFLILEEKLSAFHHYDVSCGFVISGLYYVEMSNHIPDLMREFSLWMMLNVVKCFFCIYWDDHVVFILLLLMWCTILIDLWILNHLCIPGINFIWSQCMTLFIYCWIQFANILLRTFASIYHILACNFLFLVASLSGFGIRVMVAS